MSRLASRFDPQRIRRTVGAASCVRQRSRFVVNELRDIPGIREYRLRESDLLVEIRHPVLDMWVLEEVFRFGVYEPPPPVKLALGGLGPPLRVLDLGGHVGCFALFALGRFPGSTVVSFEPDPRNAPVLKRCIEANGMVDRWQLVEACAATSDGTAEFLSSFHLSRIGEASGDSLSELQRDLPGVFPFLADTQLLSSESVRVAKRDVFPFLGAVDLLKVDIEGAEWEILADPRLSELSAAAIVLEYHPRATAVPDPGGEIRRQLTAAGYLTGFVTEGPDAGLLWAWKEENGRRG